MQVESSEWAGWQDAVARFEAGSPLRHDRGFCRDRSTPLGELAGSSFPRIGQSGDDAVQFATRTLRSAR